MRHAWMVVAALGAACAAPAAPSVTAEISCVPLARALSQLCTVTLTDRATGRPVEGAKVTLSADMPSMPLAHSVPPAGAAGTAPGVYRGTLELEMAGRWVIAARVTGPVSDQFTRVVDVE